MKAIAKPWEKEGICAERFRMPDRPAVEVDMSYKAQG